MPMHQDPLLVYIYICILGNLGFCFHHYYAVYGAYKYRKYYKAQIRSTVVFYCLHIILSGYHHYTDFSLKALRIACQLFLSSLCLRLSQFSQLSVGGDIWSIPVVIICLELYLRKCLKAPHPGMINVARHKLNFLLVEVKIIFTQTSTGLGNSSLIGNLVYSHGNQYATKHTRRSMRWSTALTTVFSHDVRIFHAVYM